MILIQGLFEGNIITEDRLDTEDEEFVEALVTKLYTSGCIDFVSVKEIA